MAAGGSPLEIVRRSIAKKQDELKRTEERFSYPDPITGGPNSEVRPILRELAVLNDQLELALDREKQFKGTGKIAGEVYRPRAALVSKVDGQTYPLLLQLARPVARPAGGFVARVSDVTSRDAGLYEGVGKTELEATWDAMTRLAGHSEYGKGSMAVRLPAVGPYAQLSDKERQRSFDVYPRDWAAARQSLNDLATLLMLLGMLVPGVGEVAALLAAGLAAERVIERVQAGTFRVDDAFVGDVLAVLGGVTTSVNVIGRLTVVRTAGKVNLVLGEGGKVAKAAAKAGEVVGYASMLQADLSIIAGLAEIEEEERNNKITATAARRKKLDKITDAINANLIILGAGRGHGEEGGERRTGGQEKTAGSETPPVGGGDPVVKAGEPTAKAGESVKTREPGGRAEETVKTAEPAGKPPPTPTPETAVTRFQEAVASGRPEASSAGEDVIKSMRDWKGALDDYVKSLPDKLQPKADAALASARKAIVDRVAEAVKKLMPDVEAVDVGTASRTSDIDLNWKAKDGSTLSLRDQVLQTQKASELFLDLLRKEIRGETDVVLDVNSYYFLAESRAPGATPEERAGLSKVTSSMGLAEQRRGQTVEQWESFKRSMLDKIPPEDKATREKITADLAEADAIFNRLSSEETSKRAEIRAASPVDAENVVARKAREAMLADRTRQLADAMAKSPVDQVEVARLQHEARWLLPDAYASQAAFDYAVRYNQERRAAGKEAARSRGAAEPSAEEVNADLAKTWAEEVYRTNTDRASGASANLGHLEAHRGSAEVKPTAKYAARILALFRATGLRPGGDPRVIDGLAKFTASRMDIWSPDEKAAGVPDRLVLDWAAQFAEPAERTTNLKGEVVSVTGTARARLNEAIAAWARDAVVQMQLVAASKPEAATAGPQKGAPTGPGAPGGAGGPGGPVKGGPGGGSPERIPKLKGTEVDVKQLHQELSNAAGRIGDDMAQTKLRQIFVDDALDPKLKQDYLAKLLEALRGSPRVDPEAVTRLMKEVLASDPERYVLHGQMLDADVLQSNGLLSREVGLRDVYHYLLDRAARDRFRSVDEFMRWVNKMPEGSRLTELLNMNAGVSGANQEGYWYPKKYSENPSMTVGQIIKMLAIESKYGEGMLRFNISPRDAMRYELWKPTALDGLVFPEFVPAPGEVWGITKGNVKEAVAKPVPVTRAVGIELVLPGHPVVDLK